MNKICKNKLLRNSLLNNHLLSLVLIISYCLIYGITAPIVLNSLQLLFFVSSVVIALTAICVRDPLIQKHRIKKGILYSQIVGTVLVFAYVCVFGLTSLALLSGFQLLFFMSSYAFAMSIFYIRDPERMRREEVASGSFTNVSFAEVSPCFINSHDLSWLVREINSSLSPVIGFSELMLKREHSDLEKEYMMRNIYQYAISIANSINKVASIIPDPQVKPKEVHEVVDLLADKNFK